MATRDVETLAMGGDATNDKSAADAKRNAQHIVVVMKYEDMPSMVPPITVVEAQQLSRAASMRAWLDKARTQPSVMLVAVSLALLADGFAYGLYTPALPRILGNQLGVVESQQQHWISMLFAMNGAGMLIASPIAGWLADRARKPPFIVGAMIEITAMILFGIGRRLWVICISRVLSGVAAGIVTTIGLALIVDIAEKEKVGRWMGYAISVQEVSIAIAPSIGGALFGKGGIWSLAGLSIGLAVFDLFLRLFAAAPAERKRDESGAHHSSIMAGSDEVMAKDLTIDDESPVAQGINTVKPQISRGDASMHRSMRLPAAIRILGCPRILSACYGLFVYIIVVVSMETVLAVFTQQQLGLPTFASGLVLLASRLPLSLGFVAGWLADIFGPRMIALLGTLLTPLPLIWLRTVTRGSTEQVALLCILLVLTGVFASFLTTALCTDLSAAVDEMIERIPGMFGGRGACAAVTSLYGTCAAAASIAGPFMSGSLHTSVGWGNMCLVSAACCASACVPIVIFIPSKRCQGPRDLNVSNGDAA